MSASRAYISRPEELAIYVADSIAFYASGSVANAATCNNHSRGDGSGISGPDGETYAGGTSWNPDPGQNILPVQDRAAYIEWIASWQNPNRYSSTGAALELLSIPIFCSFNTSECPGQLFGQSYQDWATADAVAVGMGAAASIGRGDDDFGAPSLAEREQPTAERELDQLACEGGQSFTPATRVLLATGKTIPISQLQPGQ